MKPKSLQTSVSKRGARAESVLVSLLVLQSFHRCSQKLLKTLSSHYPILGRFLSQFEAGANREGGYCGTRGAGGGGGEGEGRRSAELVSEIVSE